MNEYLRFVFALGFVLALMGLCGYLARRAGWGALPGKRGRGRRLHLLEVRALDGRHKMALVQCDDQQHLIVLGPEAQTVIATNIPPPADTPASQNFAPKDAAA